MSRKFTVMPAVTRPFASVGRVSTVTLETPMPLAAPNPLSLSG